MKIISTQRTNNISQNSLNQPVKRTNFTAHYDYGQIKELVGDGLIYKRGNIHNYSELMRDMQLFLELPKILEEKFPNGVKIYDYASSAGYESASINIGLHNGMTEEKVAKYIPIIARDKNTQIIKQAMKFRFRFNEDELERLKFFENINKEEFLIKKRKGFDDQQIYDGTDKLKQEIIFEQGDLFKDLDEGKLSNEPTVIFFRNVWQYLTPIGAMDLAGRLGEKLQPKSLVIIGVHDFYHSRIDRYLERVGFRNLAKSYPIKFNNKELSTKYKNSYASFKSSAETFCFEKV